MNRSITIIVLIVLAVFLFSCSDDSSSSSSDSPFTIIIIYYIDAGADGDWFTSDDVIYSYRVNDYFSKNEFMSALTKQERVLRQCVSNSLFYDLWEWNLDSMRGSLNIGADAQWLTSDDTFQGIIDSFKENNSVNILSYDASVYPTLDITGRRLFTMNGNLLTKELIYSDPGADGIWNTSDDGAGTGSSFVVSRDSANRIKRVTAYSGDEAVFENVIVLVYDTLGRLNTLTNYGDIDETIITGGFDCEYSSDGNTIEIFTKDSLWNSTGRRTYEYSNAVEFHEINYSDAGADTNWGTDDDTVNGAADRTYTNGLPDKLIIYLSDEVTVNAYIDYSY